MHTLSLIERTVLAGDISLFRFERPRHFEWVAGQHVMVLPPGDTDDAQGSGRALSIATAPHEPEVWFVTHCSPDHSQFKQALLALSPGDTVQATDPLGTFMIGSTPPPHFWVGAGVGVAPYRGILLDMEHRKLDLHGGLLQYSATGTFLFQSDFDALAVRHPELHIWYHTDSSLKEDGGIKDVVAEDGTTWLFSGMYIRSIEMNGVPMTDPALTSEEARQEAGMFQEIRQLIAK